MIKAKDYFKANAYNNINMDEINKILIGRNLAQLKDEKEFFDFINYLQRNNANTQMHYIDNRNFRCFVEMPAMFGMFIEYYHQFK